MTDRLFMHIGMMKSGTTYIQNMCDRNADALRDFGLLWLGGSAEQQAAAVNEFRHAETTMPDQVGAWDGLRQQAARHPGDALLSHELLASLPAQRVRPFLEALQAAETTVIITVRDLSRVIPSRWQETTQNRGTTSWADYLDAVCSDRTDSDVHRNFWRQADVGKVLRNWSAVVPPERIKLVTVPPSTAERGELWRRFASIIGSTPELSAATKAFGNISLGAVSAELMLRMNTRVDDLTWPAYRMGFKAGMAKRGLAKRARSEPRVHFPADRWGWVEERTDRMIAEIKAVGPVVVGDLDELIPVPASSDVPGLDWAPSDAELLDAALDGLEALGRQLADARLQLRAPPAGSADVPEPPAPSWLRRARAAARRRIPVARR
ncbi:MAG TPA: hypothetical protein VFJ14_17195 [Nocardioidaceae bacterium]|nr:hypothetical protein [Nocardioidaceae bacterium]